jgi:hypothetical protein
MHIIAALVAAVGGESSPLSVNSTFAEILRLVQVGIFAGILYLINQVKQNHTGNDVAHGQVLGEIRELKEDVKTIQDAVKIIKGTVT